MNTKMLIIPLLAGLLAGCAQVTVHMDYDPDVDFSQYQTFSWMLKLEEEPARRRNTLAEPFLEKKIKKTVLENLATKGYEKTSSKPDFLIACYVNFKRKTDVTVQRYGFSYGYLGQEVGVHRYKEGTLILDFVDPRSHQLIWRGWSISAVHSGSSPQEEQENINKAVEEILKQFPPY